MEAECVIETPMLIFTTSKCGKHMNKNPQQFSLCLLLQLSCTFCLSGKHYTKIVLYKTLIRPVVSYGAEVWTLTEKEEQAVLILM